MVSEILYGDCLEALSFLEEMGDSFAACITDPPYELNFMARGWDRTGVAFQSETWAAILRLLKPGAYLAAFSGARTYHRMVCAIEDAGFIIHPMLGWIFGNGWPKGCRIDAAGWEGWRYGLQSMKPALEPICLAQKPMSEKTGTANILHHGTGAIHIDAGRTPVSADDRQNYGVNGDEGPPTLGVYGDRQRVGYARSPAGRWPANLVHDGSPGAIEALGTAARFFYCAKAAKWEREGNHPTVKPVALMEWLVKLVTPPNAGPVLDPFCGTGSTLVACNWLGFDAVGIEQDEQTCADARAKIERLSTRGKPTSLGRRMPSPPQPSRTGARNF